MRHLVVTLCVLTGCEASLGGVDPLVQSDEDDPTYEPLLDWRPDAELDSDIVVCAPGDAACDMVDELDVEEEATEAPTGMLAASNRTPWPNGIIPYVIDDSVNRTTRYALGQAMTNWTTQTENRIRFRARRSTDSSYVRITQGNPLVRPHTGYRAGSVVTMQLRDNEYVTVIKHELGHVIGFSHEHKRYDRSDFIDVRPGNVVDSSLCEYQFSRTEAGRGVPYDRVSIMHYRTTEMSSCRTGPVLRRFDGSAINHVWKLSRKDLEAVARRYDPPAGTCRQETAAQVCTRHGYECGSLTAKDNCGNTRTVDCGACTGGELAAWAATVEQNGSMSQRGVCATAAGMIASDTCRDGDEQDWRTTRQRQLTVKQSLGCATVMTSSTAGAMIEERDCDEDDNAQKWLFKDMEIVNGRTGECLRVPGANYFAGQDLIVTECTGGASQKFNYRPDTEEIRAGGFCLAAQGGAEAGNPVVLQSCDGRRSQRWFQGRGGFVSRDNTSQCMRVANGAIGGTTIEVNDCNDLTGQRWALRGMVRDMRNELCLQGSMTVGTPLTLGKCDSTTNQVWTFWSR